MKNLINALIGGALADIPADVPRAWAEALWEMLSGLEKQASVRSGLPRDMHAYVLRGEPLSVLAEAGSVEAVAAHLHLDKYSSGNQTQAEKAFYGEFDRVPAAVALRWARLLDAIATQPGTARCHLVFPGQIHWPEILLLHAAGRPVSGWSSGGGQVPGGLSFACVEVMLAEDGHPPSALVAAALASPLDQHQYGAQPRLDMVCAMAGFADAVRRHAATVRPLLLTPSAAQRVHMMQAFNSVAAPDTVALFGAEIVELATSSSKQVRIAAEPVVYKGAAGTLAALKTLASQGRSEQRVHALNLLWEMARKTNDASLRAFAREHAEADKAAGARALLEQWDREGAAGADDEALEVEAPVIEWKTEITPELSAALDALWADINAMAARENKETTRRYHELMAAGHKWARNDQLVPVGDKELARLRSYLESAEPKLPGKPVTKSGSEWQLKPLMLRFARQPGITPVAALKTMLLFADMDGENDRLEGGMASVFNALHKATGRPALLELGQMMEAVGHPASDVLESYCYVRPYGVLANDWPDDAVWPFFARHIDVLLEYFKSNTERYWFDRKGLFRAVATLPRPPERLAQMAFTMAIGSGKTDRLPAQQALDKLPGKEARIIAALEDGKAEARTVAAQWLTRLRHAPAQAALEKAVVKEKNDVAKGAMLDALQALGQPVEKYLNRDALAKEAEKTLAKGLPKELAWFPWGAMPEVRWADSGDAVPPDVLRWMLAQAVKQKTSEPNAVLRKYCSMFEPRGREAFGQFVLESWLREDVRPISADEAMQRARDSAQQTWNYIRQYPQYYQNHPHLNQTVEQITAALLPGMLKLPAGSATSSRGLLAVAAACCAERAAPAAARYLKEYYGTRAAQGKALIAMLAWIEHPSAIQLMLSVGNRFRTKSFQEEAMRQAEALAERRGWTVSELADRTIPTAGFDETGSMELSYGERRFTARLQPDFKVALFNAEGKAIKALPEPRQDEDAELAREARKAYSSAKKEIKNIVDLQTDRLYEALCTERDWPWEDWEQYLNVHPVVRRLVHRLVWCQVEEGRVIQVFRPLEDGTLTDADDNEIKLPAAARVRIAHDTLLNAEDVARWQQHLQDYEIVPLFQQLGKGTYALPAERGEATEIADFEGHMLEAFALRGRALKLGYTRGAAQDGGWFYTYEKRFPTLGLLAVIEFTGNGLPEENRAVALRRLHFEHAGGGDEYNQEALPLAELPKVLLSECYNDMRLLAAEGSGFDREWEKKCEY